LFPERLNALAFSSSVDIFLINNASRFSSISKVCVVCVPGVRCEREMMSLLSDNIASMLKKKRRDLRSRDKTTRVFCIVAFKRLLSQNDA